MRPLAAALLLAAVAGCSAIDVHPFDTHRSNIIQTKWLVELNSPPLLAYFPKEYAVPEYADSGRLVLAGSDDGDVVGVDTRTGKVRWRFETEGKIRGHIAVEGSGAYFGSTDGRFYKVDARTGVMEWDAPYVTRGVITAEPAVSGGMVVFQNSENRTYALDAETGAYRWDQGRPAPDFLTVRGEGGPTIDDDRVYVGYDDGFLVSSRLADGATIWSKNLGGNERRFVDVDTKPVVYGNLLYVASFAVGLYAIDKEHGSIRWLHQARGVTSPAMGDRFLFITTGQGEVQALDPATGKRRWMAQIPYGELGPPTFSAERLWVPTGDGLIMMDAARGIVTARITPDDGQTAAVASLGSWVHFVTNSGLLVGARVYYN